MPGLSGHDSVRIYSFLFAIWIEFHVDVVYVRL